MKVDVLLGLQWGDEGKPKTTSIFFIGTVRIISQRKIAFKGT